MLTYADVRNTCSTSKMQKQRALIDAFASTIAQVLSLLALLVQMLASTIVQIRAPLV
jgi:dihydroneopterin aldolase